jgi:CDGSH-type Zn-finger protein
MEEDKNEKKANVRIEILDEGPVMKITGDFTLKDLKRDFEDSPAEVILCLCGKSKNKPYCDNSHKNS